MTSMSKTIEIIISPNGETTVQTKGFTGSSCRQATSALEKALGRVTNERTTAEFHSAAEEARNKASQG